METTYLVETATKVVCDVGAQETMLRGVWHVKHFGVKDERKLEDLRSHVKKSSFQPSMTHPSPTNPEEGSLQRSLLLNIQPRFLLKDEKFIFASLPGNFIRQERLTAREETRCASMSRWTFTWPAEGSFERSPGRLSLPSRRNHGDSDVLPPSLQ